MSAELRAQLAEAQATIRTLQEELNATNRGLLALNLELEQRVDERTEAIRRRNATLQGINRVLQAALSCRSEEELGGVCLEVAAEVTQSKFGFIGELNEHGLQDIAISNPGWDACQALDPAGHRRPPGNFKVHGLYGRVLSSGQSLFTNDPAHHPDSIGMPPGHPPLQAFLGVPLLKEGRTIGMIAVGNRPGGYTPEQQQALEALAPAIVEAFLRKRAEHALEQAQTQLQAYAHDLERTVAARTAKLHETIDELEHFSYAIVHDMRAPLRAMQGFVELIEEECARCPHPAHQEYLPRIKIAARRMDRLIVDSLHYSTAVRQELPLQPVDLVQLLRGLIQTYPNLQADQADIHIEPTLPVVLGNEAALTQCFSNLLGNSVKFAKPGLKPQIRVWAESVPTATAQLQDPEGRVPAPALKDDNTPTQPPLVRVWVEDNGMGIPSYLQPRVFDMFQRGTNHQEGTGIGLAIVRKVAQRMGGEVGVESLEGQGSRFWVELPLAGETPGSRTSPAA